MPKVWQFGETIKGNDKLNYIKYKNIFSLKNNLGELKKKNPRNKLGEGIFNTWHGQRINTQNI